MIPERNLMAASGLQDKQQSIWVADITDMMAEGPNVILRLPKIRQAIVASPEPLLWFSKTRMELEMLFLEALNRHKKCSDGNGVVNESDAIMHAIGRRCEKLMMEVAQRMHTDSSAVYDMFDVLS
ncbi:hypothetical protein DPMN_039463 [Dreissena polymorpha]|uniref:Uncharacterized protein n=1 Tax=Dreissena polymorpha TaxID=45954 RepID=A0A9D4CVY7_DREPO|nr:hypothetical protein DPMN_039463 [Dreissena polymorpha]